MARRLILLVSLLLVTSCAQRTVVTGTELTGAALATGNWIREELYFGLSKPNGDIISAAEFNTFVEREIVKRLPAGFTIVEGDGHWLDNRGVTIKEPGRVLIKFYRESERETAERIIEIALLYKRLFSQEAVMRTTTPAKVVFH